MAIVQRFIFPGAVAAGETVFVPGAGTFVNGKLDIDASDLATVNQVRALVTALGAVDTGTFNTSTPQSATPTGDPYPQYLTLTDAANSVQGGTDQFAAALKAAYVAVGGIDSTPITATDFGLTVPQGVRAYANATAQTVTNGAYPVYLDLNTQDYNENSSLFTIDLTNDKITVSAGGLFLVSWDVDFADSAALREAYITKNGGNAILAAAAGAGGQAGRTAPIRLAAGDYVQVICYVTGANVALTTNAPHRCGLALHRIGL